MPANLSSQSLGPRFSQRALVYSNYPPSRKPPKADGSRVAYTHEQHPYREPKREPEPMTMVCDTDDDGRSDVGSAGSEGAQPSSLLVDIGSAGSEETQPSAPLVDISSVDVGRARPKEVELFPPLVDVGSAGSEEAEPCSLVAAVSALCLDGELSSPGSECSARSSCDATVGSSEDRGACEVLIPVPCSICGEERHDSSRCPFNLALATGRFS